MTYAQQPQAEAVNNLQISETAEKSPFYAAVKTNMLYDAAAIPNIAAEFYLGHDISVGADWMYAWWSNNNYHRYWRIYGGNLNVRYWFNNLLSKNKTLKPLRGHHIGLYGGIFTFDMEFGGIAHMGGSPGHNLWKRPMINVGIEYGYSLPITKHLDIDFCIGAGYIGGTVEKFKPIDGYMVWLSTSRRTWIGPTKAEISLVWLLGRGNTNVRKGGNR